MDKKSILHLTTVTSVVAGAELLILELTRHQKEMFSDYQICVACIKSRGYFVYCQRKILCCLKYIQLST